MAVPNYLFFVRKIGREGSLKRVNEEVDQFREGLDLI